MTASATRQPHRPLLVIAALLATAAAAASVFELWPAHAWVPGLAVLLTIVAGALLARAFVGKLESRMTRMMRRHEELVQSIDGVVWEAETDPFRFTFVSQQAEAMFGHAVADWFRPGFWAAHIHPDDRAMVTTTMATCGSEKMSAELEYRILAQGGTSVWVHDRISCVADDGQPVLLRGLATNITTRRAQEDQTQRLLVEKESILDNALVGIVHIKDRSIVSCNRRFEEIFGYTPGELIGESTERLYASRDVFITTGERARRALGEGRSHTEAVSLRRKGGSVFWGAINGRAIDPAHPDDGSIWIYADISERRQAEAEAHKLLLAVEQSPVSIVITDRDGRIEYINPRFTRITGYTLDEVIGRQPSILKSNETPLDTYRELWSTLLDGREWRGRLCNRRKNGELFWEDAAISPILNERREITHFLAVKEDISEHKQAEDALHDSHDAYMHLLATTLDGFFLADAEGYLLDVNAAYIRQSGYSHDELLGLRIADLSAQETAAETVDHLRRIAGHGSDQFESLHRRKDGSLWHVEVSASYRQARGGQFFVFLRDITARKQIQQQLEDHQQHLEELVRRRTADLAAALEAAKVAERAKDAFLANVSHELRTPLNVVIGLSGLARRNSTDPRQRDTLQKISDSGQTLLAVINDLLDLTKIAAGEMRFEVTTFSLRQVAARVRSVMALRAGEKGLLLSERIDDAVPDVLVGDPLRVEQILLNLVNNAIKFTASGEVALRISTTAAPDANETKEAKLVRLRIEVEDSGIGMSEDEIGHLFKPFGQADASITRKYGGTGLGLAICKRLAEGMDGSLGVTSRPGHGSTFHALLWLGLGRPGDLPDADESKADHDLPRSYPDARVLLVDDQPLNREVVFEILGTVDIVPRLACNGQEALDILTAAGPGAFDLVLMDIQMPVMDGLTATREIRARPEFAGLQIAAMTAHTMEHEKAVYRAAGMNDHIGKPFNMSSFFRLLAKWLPHPTVDTVHAPDALPAAGGDDSVEDLPAVTGLDTHAALERFAGNTARYRHWLAVFVDESAGFVAGIDELLAAGRQDDARKAAHAFKGRVGMLGMTGLHGLAAALEKALQAGESIAAAIAPMAAAIAAMRRDLQAGLGAAIETAAENAPATPAAAAPARPAGPLPASVASLIAMLDAADGGSSAAIERCLGELRDTPWAPLLDQALTQARRFDFEAARRIFVAPEQDPNHITTAASAK